SPGSRSGGAVEEGDGPALDGGQAELAGGGQGLEEEGPGRLVGLCTSRRGRSSRERRGVREG
ncbi:MAG: hypothetical protein ACRD0M_12190, partial [Acidimicrobiales bacterium]